MKNISIEVFLTWAFTRELCKGRNGAGRVGQLADAWRAMGEMAELGTLIDRSPNNFGVIPDILAEDDPHPDALAAGHAVRALAEMRFAVPDGELFPGYDDPHGLIAQEVAAVRADLARRGDGAGARHVVALVINAAILGRGPDVACEQPRFRMIESYGKPAWFVERRMRDAFGGVHVYEDDGYDARVGKPKLGAYRKWQLAEPMRGSVMARIDWLWWREALRRISDALAGNLRESQVVIDDTDQNGMFVRQAGAA